MRDFTSKKKMCVALGSRIGHEAEFLVNAHNIGLSRAGQGGCIRDGCCARQQSLPMTACLTLICVEAQPDTHKSQICLADLLEAALRHRSDRILIGEIRGEDREVAAELSGASSSRAQYA
jgi:hypothetical protein